MFCDSQKIPLTKGNIAIANANCLHKAASDKTEMWEILAKLMNLKNIKHPCGWMIQKGLLLQLIGYMMSDCTEDISHENIHRHKKNEPVKKALDFIRRHYKEPISLDTLCAYTGFSKYYFCRLFKHFTFLPNVQATYRPCSVERQSCR